MSYNACWLLPFLMAVEPVHQSHSLRCPTFDPKELFWFQREHCGAILVDKCPTKRDQPLSVFLTGMRFNWTYFANLDSFQNQNDSSVESWQSPGFWGGTTEMFSFSAEQLKIQPKQTEHNPCVKMSFVTCPRKVLSFTCFFFHFHLAASF